MRPKHILFARARGGMVPPVNLKAITQAALASPGISGRSGLPLIYWGPPGIGKSSMLTQYVEELGLEPIVVIASLREPADFLGLMVPREGGGVAYEPPEWAILAAQAEQSVVIFDEITTCSPMVQNALLRVILDGVVGDLELPRSVRFLAAANPPEMTSGGFTLALALANRFGHVDVEAPKTSDWSDWLIANAGGEEAGLYAEAHPPSFPKEAWDDAYANARGTVAGFISARPSLLLSVPEMGDKARGRAWPSPRSWHMAANAIAAAKCAKLGTLEASQMVSAYVGTGAAAEFTTWLVNTDLPSARDVLTRKVKWAHEDARPDRTVAVLNACASYCVAHPTKGFVDQFWRLCKPLAASRSDLVFHSARAMTRARLIDGEAALEVFDALAPVFIEAGIVPGGRK